MVYMIESQQTWGTPREWENEKACKKISMLEMKEELKTTKTYYKAKKNSSLDMAKEKISKWEYKSEETATNEAQNQKEMGKRAMKDGLRSSTINLKTAPCANPLTPPVLGPRWRIPPCTTPTFFSVICHCASLFCLWALSARQKPTQLTHKHSPDVWRC